MAHFQKLKQPHLSLLSFLSTTLLISSTQSQQAISTDPSYYYNLCVPSRCNNYSLLPHPFVLPTPCHPSTIQPFCPNNRTLLIRSPRTSDTFRILSINFSDSYTTEFVFASESLFTCGEQVSGPNFHIDRNGAFSLPFNIAPGTHFNCTSPIPSNSVRDLQNASCIGCQGQDPSNVCYYAPGFVGLVTAPNCETYQMFTSGTAFNASSVRDMRGLLQLGYEVRYNQPAECRGCATSGGRCGVNPSSGSFVCFCPSSVHRGNCSDDLQLGHIARARR